VNGARLQEIMAHAKVLFEPEWSLLRDKHEEDLRQARFKAQKTGNSAAMFPAEAACYVAHAKALIVAKANCIATAYTSFHEAAGREADAELSTFFATVVAARKASFAGHAKLVGMRTRRSTSQVPYLLHGFERDANVALLEGRRILDKQRVEMKNKQHQAAPHIAYNVQGPNARITINGTDNSSNTAVVGSLELFQQIRTELEKQLPNETLRKGLIHSLEDIEQATSKKTATERYDRFVALAANHATLMTALSPLLFQLTQWAASLKF
jgi:hypothetical protein